MSLKTMTVPVENFVAPLKVTLHSVPGGKPAWVKETVWKGVKHAVSALAVYGYNSLLR